MKSQPKQNKHLAPREYKMIKSLAINRGNHKDAKFLATLDTLTEPTGPTKQDRLDYWKTWEFTNSPEPPNVWVARVGGLYVGYLALQSLEVIELRVQERFDSAYYSGLLLQRAGIQLPEESENQNLATV